MAGKKMAVNYKTVFIFVLLLISASLSSFSCKPDSRKGIEQQDTFVYDEDYASLYDDIWHRDEKYKSEVDEIISNLKMPLDQVRMLDAGCGTGTHYRLLSEKVDIVGLDISKAMLRQARRKNPSGKFKLGDINDRSLFPENLFTHIISMFEASFYTRNLARVASNYSYWLQPGGRLMIATIDRDKIKDIGEQVRKKDTFVHKGWWRVPETGNIVHFDERIDFKDGAVIEKKHVLYLPGIKEIQETIQSQGFKLVSMKYSEFFKQEVVFMFEKTI